MPVVHSTAPAIRHQTKTTQCWLHSNKAYPKYRVFPLKACYYCSGRDHQEVSHEADGSLMPIKCKYVRKGTANVAQMMMMWCVANYTIILFEMCLLNNFLIATFSRRWLSGPSTIGGRLYFTETGILQHFLLISRCLSAPFSVGDIK